VIAMSTSVSMRRLRAVTLVLLVVAGFTLARRLQAPDAAIVSMATTASSAQPASLGAPAASAQPVSPGKPARTLSTERPQRLAIALRLDPTLTQGLFMGDRWVSPADFHFAQPGSVFVVEAKAQHRDGRGEPHDLAGNWNATNPAMVAIQRDAHAVTLEIRQPGDSDVTIAAGGETAVLHVHAVQLADSIQVHIRQ
jgi:hypothetical protein